ncbi:MAG: PAS domain S-box protein, partial [Spirochaetes bacterium]|nr:PAS domain S-box protein [Spirochaetota bacterium]
MLFNYFHTNNLKKNMEEELSAISQSIEYSYSNSLWYYDKKSITNLNKSILSNDLFVAINIYTSYGFYAGEIKILSEKEVTYQVIDQPYEIPKNNKSIQSIKVDIRYDESHVGYCELFYTTSSLYHVIRTYTRNGLLSFFISVPMIIIALFFSINKLILKPVMKITNYTKEISRTNSYDLQLEIHSADEIGSLTNDINNMLSQINKRDIEINQIKRLLSSIIESMPSVLIAIDENSVITQWNQAAVMLTGIDTSDALGNNLWNLFPLLSSYKYVSFKSLESSVSKEFLDQQIGDIEKYFNIYVYPLTSEGQKGIVFRIDDITELI